jgi:hypothetical protein
MESLAVGTEFVMFSSTFIFGLKPLDEDFHRLNDEIVHAARQIPGFLGEEAWHKKRACTPRCITGRPIKPSAN